MLKNHILFTFKIYLKLIQQDSNECIFLLCFTKRKKKKKEQIVQIVPPIFFQKLPDVFAQRLLTLPQTLSLKTCPTLSGTL